MGGMGSDFGGFDPALAKDMVLNGEKSACLAALFVGAVREQAKVTRVTAISNGSHGAVGVVQAVEQRTRGALAPVVPPLLVRYAKLAPSALPSGCNPLRCSPPPSL